MLIYEETSFFGVIAIFSQNAISPKIIFGVFTTFLQFPGVSLRKKSRQGRFEKNGPAGDPGGPNPMFARAA